MSSNLVVEEPMAADPAKNPGGDELREETSVVESTEGVEIRGSIETITEEKTTVVATETTKVELLGSELGSEDKSTGGLQGDDLLEDSLKKDPSYVESSVAGGVEEGNDPTEISLHDLTGGLDIDGKPSEGGMEEVVVEASVENEMVVVPSSTEIAGESKDGSVNSLCDEQIQVPESRLTGAVLEQPKLEGIEEYKVAEETGKYTSEKESSKELEKEKRLVDGDKTGDTLEAQIGVEEIKDVITPVEKVIEDCDRVKVLEEGTEDFSAKAAIVGQSEEVAEENNNTSNKPDIEEGPTVEENEEVVKEAASDSCIDPMDVVPPIELSAVGPVHIVGIESVSVEIPEEVTRTEQPGDLVLHTHEPMSIDGAINSETVEAESGKEAGGDNQKLDADKETSQLGETSTGKEKASSLEQNDIAQDIAHADGKEAVVYHRREKYQMTKNATPSPELQKEETVPGEIHITYNIPSVEKDGFAISDLVWGKVKSHPWWPGVIINPSDGSNLAMKYQKRDTFLVAYFGDKTFAWCDESQLKPFFPNFSHFEKQASSDAFSNAVRSVLVEVCRRFEVGTICSCLDEKQYAKEVYPKLENAGVRQGFVNCAVDRYEMVKYFNPKGLVDFVKDSALVPTNLTTDKLELVIITSQIKAFYRLKGYSVPPKYQTFGPLEEYIEPVIVLSRSEELPQDSVMPVQTPPAVTPPALSLSVNYTPVELGVVEKPKKKRGRPPKKKREELDIEVQKPLSELVRKKVHSNLSNGSNSKPEKTTDEEDSASPLPWKKRKEVVGFDPVENENQVQIPRSSGFGISFKIGECISRAASRLTGSGSGSSPLISTPKFDSADFDVSSDDETPMPTTNEEKRVRRRRLKKYHYSDPKDVLSQLCLIATGPGKEYGFLGTVVSYFTDFRNFVVEPPPSTETGYLPEKVKLRRGRKRKVDLPQTPSDEVVTPTDHMQDSYWSDMILCGQTEETSSWPKQRKRRVSIETKHLKLSPGGPDEKRALAVAAAATKRSIIRVEEKRLDEYNPTALLLSFGTRYGTVPSEMDIVRIFSRYGPLKEWEMGKVEGSTNRVWIIFKRRADAEMAFSNLRKQNVFGPSLLSYRLVYEVPEKREQDKKIKVPNGEEHFELQAPEETVNLPSIAQGDDASVDLSRNLTGLHADEMLVDPLSNAEGSDVALGDNVDEIAIDPSSNVEGVDVAQDDDMDEIPADITSNVEDGDMDAMSIDPSSTVQVEAVTEMLIEPLSSTAEIPVDSSSNMQVDNDNVTKISADHLSSVQNEAVDENLADPSSMAKVEAVSEAAVKPSDIVHVEAVADILISPASTTLDEAAGQLSIETGSTVQVGAVNEVLADEFRTVKDGNVVVEPSDPSTAEQDEVTIAKSVVPSCAVQGVAVATVSVNQLNTVQDGETVANESHTVPNQNCGQTDPPSILHSEIVSDVSIVPESAKEGEVFVEAPVDRTNTEEGEDVGALTVETTKTEQGELVGEMLAEPGSTEQGKLDGDVLVEPASSEQGGRDDLIPVEPSSTREGEAIGKMSVEPASTGQGEVVGEVPVEVSSIGQGDVIIELPVDPSSTAQGEVVGEVPVESPSIKQEVAVEMPVDPSSTAEGEEVGEIPVEPSSPEQVEEGEVQFESAETIQDGERPVEPLSTEEGEVASEVSFELASTEQGKVVAEVSVELSKTEQDEVITEVSVDPSSIAQGEKAAEEESVEKPVCTAEHFT